MFINRFPAWFPAGRTLLTVVASALVGGSDDSRHRPLAAIPRGRKSGPTWSRCAFPSLGRAYLPQLGGLTRGPGTRERPRRLRPDRFGGPRSGREELDVEPNHSFRQARRSRACQDRAREHQGLRRHARGASRPGGRVARLCGRPRPAGSFVLCPWSFAKSPTIEQRCHSGPVSRSNISG